MKWFLALVVERLLDALIKHLGSYIARAVKKRNKIKATRKSIEDIKKSKSVDDRKDSFNNLP